MIIPDGFATVVPYIFAADPLGLAEFLHRAFNGQERGRTMAPDGSVANLQIMIGDITLMMSQSSDQFPPSQSAFYLYVEDADSSMALALQCGAEQIMPVADMRYQDRQGGVRDPAGNIWWISQRLVAAPYHD